MRIDIQGCGYPLTAALLDHTERRLRFALTRTSDRIKRVVVRLGDTQGPRGGTDKFCRIRVVLANEPPVLIEDAGPDLYIVIDRVTERAGRNLAMHVGRSLENVRQAISPGTGSPSGAMFDAFRN